MPRWQPRLVLYLLLPYLITVPPLLAVAYVLSWRALDVVADEVAGSRGLAEARAIAERLAVELPASSMAQRCHDEVRGSVTRLTVIGADGTVLCDSQADASSMVNHLERPEVRAALRTGTGIARRLSTTVHTPLVYSAVRVQQGDAVRIVRVAVPTELLTASRGRLDQVVLLTILFSGVVALLPALYMARSLGRRLERMVGFSRAVAAGDFSARLPSERRDELGILEANLSGMAETLRASFHGLRDESERVQGILRAMLEGVVVISRGGEVILINRRATELFDLPTDFDYRGRHLVEMCREPALQTLLDDVVSGDGRSSIQEIALTSVEEHHLNVSVAPFGETGAPPLGFVLVFHDITELRKLESMRRELVANVSHELRTPLTAIRGYAETLLGGALEDQARAGEFVRVIHRHAERLSRLIDDLLALSDLELGKTELKREAVEITPLVDDVFAMLRVKAEGGDVTLEKDVPAGLPVVIGDSDRLQQVLINLVDNGVKYTPAGGSVSVRARPAGAGPAAVVEITVRDTGIGIPAADLPRLTERFYRVDRARSRELGGTGLGLAIVKHIVQGHAGQLRITSEVGVGTTVRCSIPCGEVGSPGAVP